MQGRQRSPAVPAGLREVAAGRDVMRALQPGMVRAGIWHLPVQTVPERLRL